MRRRFWRGLRRRRARCLAALDTCAWMAAAGVVGLLASTSTGAGWATVAAAGLLSACLHTALARVVHLHQGRATVGSLEELVLLGGVVGATGALSALVYTLAQGLPPLAAPVAATVFAGALAGVGRVTWRLCRGPRRPVPAGGGRIVVVVGAGEGGRQILRSMAHDQWRTWRPVALVDDDPRRRNRRLSGVSVVGTCADLDTVVQRVGCSAIVVASPSADSGLLRRVQEIAQRHGIDVVVAPTLDELLGCQVGIRDLRDINVADLMGRSQIETDVVAASTYLSGRRVLVTGAGGSIGSELCRQIQRLGPAELILLDRDESALHALQLSLHGRAALDSSEVVLADIRDARAITDVFESRRPEVVFHAAALKHLPMLEQYPAEAIKTNVHGTEVVLRAAEAVGVERFVTISTDKAANPCNALGYSKRLAERLTAAAAHRSAGVYLSVRFGNVLGSRGSVLTSFAAQIAAGGPVTVTHPDVTRYFMTVTEACNLVVQAGAIGEDGQALILDMGRPVPIRHVAEHLVRIDGRDVPIVYTGLSRGEKLHEDLFGEGEPDERPIHRLVSHVDVPPYELSIGNGLDDVSGPPDLVLSRLRSACTAPAAQRPQPRPISTYGSPGLATPA